MTDVTHVCSALHPSAVNHFVGTAADGSPLSQKSPRRDGTTWGKYEVPNFEAGISAKSVHPISFRDVFLGRFWKRLRVSSPTFALPADMKQLEKSTRLGLIDHIKSFSKKPR